VCGNNVAKKKSSEQLADCKVNFGGGSLKKKEKKKREGGYLLSLGWGGEGGEAKSGEVRSRSENGGRGAGSQ